MMNTNIAFNISSNFGPVGPGPRPPTSLVNTISTSVGATSGGYLVIGTHPDTTGLLGCSVDGVPLDSFTILDGTSFQGTMPAFESPGFYNVTVSNEDGESAPLIHGWRAWDPTVISSQLAAWWDPSDSENTTIVVRFFVRYFAGIADKSGNGQDAVQLTAANQPGYWPVSVSSGTLPAWATGDNLFFDIQDFDNSLTESEIFVLRVLDPDPPDTQIAQWWLGKGDSAIPDESDVIADAFGSTAVHTSGVVSFGTDPHVYSCISSATEWSAFINFEQVYTTATNTVGFDSQAKLGVGKVTTNSGTAYIGEILMCNRKLSSADRANVQSYYATKWGPA